MIVTSQVGLNNPCCVLLSLGAACKAFDIFQKISKVNLSIAQGKIIPNPPFEDILDRIQEWSELSFQFSIRSFQFSASAALPGKLSL